MEKVTLVFLSSLSPGLVEEVISCAPANFDVKAFPEGTAMEELVPAFQNADFVLTYSTPFPDELVMAAKKARLISVLSAGYDRVNVKLARERGIPRSKQRRRKFHRCCRAGYPAHAVALPTVYTGRPGRAGRPLEQRNHHPREYL